MKTKCITSILYLEIDKSINENIFEELGFKITNNPMLINKILNPQYIKEIIGRAEYDSIINIGSVLTQEEDDDKNDKDFNERDYLIHFLKFSEFFCQALWMIKDNSVHFELSHLFYENNVHSNLWNTSYSNAIGTVENTYFNKEEINQAINIFPGVLAINLLQKPLENESIRLTSKISRLCRAFYFLTSARNTDDIGTKISIYCSVLESLFSISNTELRHRLSETVAFFLEDKYAERMTIYQAIKLAYDIRSSVVHGDGLSSKFLKNDAKLLLLTATNIDEIIRACFRKIILDDFLYDLFTEKSKEEIGNYFQDLIFK